MHVKIASKLKRPLLLHAIVAIGCRLLNSQKLPDAIAINIYLPPLISFPWSSWFHWLKKRWVVTMSNGAPISWVRICQKATTKCMIRNTKQVFFLFLSSSFFFFLIPNKFAFLFLSLAWCPCHFLHFNFTLVQLQPPASNRRQVFGYRIWREIIFLINYWEKFLKCIFRGIYESSHRKYVCKENILRDEVLCVKLILIFHIFVTV